MFIAARRRKDPQLFSLQEAVFCLDCETINNSAGDECPLCRSRSLVSLARMLGGNLFRRERNRLPGEEVRFDAVITLELREVTGGDLNRAIDELTQETASRLGHGGVVVHVEVEPSERDQAA